MEINLKRGNNFDISQIATRLIVPLMIFSAILAETIFKSLQVISELLLLGSLLFLILYKRLDKEDLIILTIYFIISIISLFYLNPLTFMLNVKQFGLPILALIYFKKKSYSSVFLYVAFILCVILLVVQKIIGYFPFPVSQYMTTLKDDFEGRPLGLFLNYHFSAFFVAVFLIGFTYKRSVFFIDYFILFLFNVQTSIMSYLGQKFFNIFFKKQGKFSLFKLVVLFLIVLFSFLSFVRYILDFLEIPQAAISGLVIFYQLTDLQTYTRLLDLFPRDIYDFYKLDLYDYSDTIVSGYNATGNEISFIQIIVQGGLILGFSFLRVILINVSIYRLFILLSLIHYSYMFSPLIIYTMCYFENRNKI